MSRRKTNVAFAEEAADPTDAVSSPDWVPKATLADGSALARSMTRGRTRTARSSTSDMVQRVEKLQSADHVRVKLRRPVLKQPKNPALEWVPLVEETPDGNANLPTHEELRTMDRRRKSLLALARSTSAIDTITKLQTLPRTVLPRLAAKPLMWLVMLVFGLAAALSRLGVLQESFVHETDSLEHYLRESGTMVTFMVVFYVGYCYNRSNEQFDDVQSIMHAINDACLAARVAFSDPDEVHRLWRYLNLLPSPHLTSPCTTGASAVAVPQPPPRLSLLRTHRQPERDQLLPAHHRQVRARRQREGQGGGAGGAREGQAR